MSGGDPASSGVVDDAIRSMEKRAQKWPAVIPADEMATYATSEFTRAVRAIHISVSRDKAAAIAVAQLAAPEESDDAND